VKVVNDIDGLSGRTADDLAGLHGARPLNDLGSGADDLVRHGDDALPTPQETPGTSSPPHVADDVPSPRDPAGDPDAPNPVDSHEASGSGWSRTSVEAEGAPRLEAGDGRPYTGYHGDSGPLPPRTSPDPDVQRTLDLVSDPGAPYGRFPDGTALEKADHDARYVLPNGAPRYPSYDGVLPGTRVTYTDPVSFIDSFGSQFDRIGSSSGTYLSVAEHGIPATFEARGLSIGSLRQPYHGYVVAPDAAMRMTEDGIRIEVARAGPAFGRPGGALQARFMERVDGDWMVLTADELLDRGYLQ
jgi:hypothetical protein